MDSRLLLPAHRTLRLVGPALTAKDQDGVGLPATHDARLGVPAKKPPWLLVDRTKRCRQRGRLDTWHVDR